MKKILILLFLTIGLALTACQTTLEKTTTNNLTTNETTYETTSATTTEPQQVINDCEKALLETVGDWEPVWCEEFDYEGLPELTKWTIENKGDGFGNNELQFYTKRPENVNVEDGELTITVKKEQFVNRNYTSAKLMSRGKGDFLYGKFEVKAKLPEGKGTWPAIWMMPSESKYGGWPNSGEIDIMEHVGYDMNTIVGTVHTGNYNHTKGTQVGKSIELDDVVDYYHIYTIEWDPTGIKWFVDGVQYHEFKNDEIKNPDNSSGNWPFDQEFYLILNVAFGGNWGGAQGIDPNFIESRMVVDYVRVFQKDYESIDEENPTDVLGYQTVTNLPSNTKISWDKSTDDTGIDHYEIYLDQEYIGNTSAPTYIFTELDPLTDYELKVIAVDFVGKMTNPTTYSFTSGDYTSIPNKINASDYTEMRGIQLQSTSDVGGGQNVAYIDSGDYLLYKLKVSETGNYRIKFRVASTSSSREIQLYDYSNNIETLLTKVTFNSTGGWQNWQTVDGIDSFNLEQGIVTIKVKAITNGFNLNWIEFVKE
ncbi:MAG: glycoside hydrolase family 16 [Haloplasmataceae bacterium]|jgi:beta-glucanase (GH16 family)|nr:glycoside hydrolase family 16 [Haloplasmataceae bacterium]